MVQIFGSTFRIRQRIKTIQNKQKKNPKETVYYLNEFQTSFLKSPHFLLSTIKAPKTTFFHYLKITISISNRIEIFLEVKPHFQGSSVCLSLSYGRVLIEVCLWIILVPGIMWILMLQTPANQTPLRTANYQKPEFFVFSANLYDTFWFTFCNMHYYMFMNILIEKCVLTLGFNLAIQFKFQSYPCPLMCSLACSTEFISQASLFAI